MGECGTQALSCLGKTVQVKPENRLIRLRVLIDRTSLEIFANGGRYVMSFNYAAKETAQALALAAAGGTARLHSLEVRVLESIWP